VHGAATVKLVAYPRHPLTGRQFTVRGRTERELQAYLHAIHSMRQELRLELITPAEVDRKLRRLRFGTVTLSKAAHAYARRPDLAKRTRERVESTIAGPLSELAGEELDALDGPRLAPLFDRLATRMSRGYLVTTWRTLRAIVRYAAERGWTARVPWGAWRPRARAGKPGRALRECARSEAERDRIIAAAAELDELGPYRAVAPKIAAAAHLGLRQGELAGLRWGDVDWSRGLVTVGRQWRDRELKGAADIAEIAAPPALFELLLRHRARLDPDAAANGKPVFPAPGGGAYASGECLSTRDLRSAVVRAGLEAASWSPHSLRDTFATLEAKRVQGDLAAVALRTRHRSLSALVRYLRPLERAAAAPLLTEG